MKLMLAGLLMLVAMAATTARADLALGLGALDRSDYATALKELAPLAEKGDVAAQVGLGKLYLYGWGVRKNAAEAAKWYQKAAEQGDAGAQKMLAYLYENGFGVEKNPAVAEKWKQLAARAREIPQTDPARRDRPLPLLSVGGGKLWETHTRQCADGLKKADYAQATKACLAGLNEAERLGPRDRRVEISAWMLAAVYHAQGQYASAEPHYRRALAVSEKTLGQNHPEVASILNSLAELYSAQGRYTAAEPLYRRALEIRNSAAAKGSSSAKAPGAGSGQSRQTTKPNPGAGSNPTTMLAADARGHFFTMGSINDAPVRMLVDTGATWVSLGSEEAWRIGLDYRNGTPVRLTTANGVTTGYRIMLDSVTVGDITLHRVAAVVKEGNPGVEQQAIVMLGMSFLSRVEMKSEGASLTLTKKAD